MKPVRSYTVLMTPEQAAEVWRQNIGSPWLIPEDDINPAHVAMLTAVYKGEAPSHVATVRLAEVVPYLPGHLEKVKDLIATYRGGAWPSGKEVLAICKDALKRGLTVWPVFRGEDGRLVMFDDYASFVAAHRLGLTHVRVQILGEAASVDGAKEEQA